ncbi:MAG: phytanoyl-CoA dioxygenase family protein [Gammaproteobacteria bacterium]|nr:phytanoyl-CoA dioxygenase family protein [Gammaproteobacteria bacterium]MDH3857942.1 phytanoyl-CoA dioxygenase family protein [Gammaproteobacteria bacterium]
MAYSLTADQVDQYQRDGFLFPLDVFVKDRVDHILGELEHARTVAREKGLEPELAQLLRANTHYLLPFVNEVARAPQLLDRVESILGPNILLWSAEFFIKAAHTDKIVSWHQDLTYWGLGETNEEMTAWLALSDVNVESGCMRFVPGSHHQQIVPHRDTFDATNLLSRGQEVAVDVAEEDAVDVILDPGQVSFHHGRMFHASGPNRSARDRIGLAFRFITPEVKQLVAKRDYAMLVRGIDEGKNWIHVSPPGRLFDPADLELHARIRQDQSTALAEGAEQELYTAY